MRFPAFLASRTDSRSLSEELAQGLPDEWQNALFGTWDASTRAALQEWGACLEPATAAVAQQIIDESASLSERRAAQLAGRLPRDPLSDANGFASRTTAHLLAPVGLEDPEHPDAPSDGLQTRLVDLVVKGRLDMVRETLRCAGDFEGLQILSDQCDAATDHSWLWALAAADGSIVPSDEFITAVRLRLGAPVIDATPSSASPISATITHRPRSAAWRRLPPRSVPLTCLPKRPSDAVLPSTSSLPRQLPKVRATTLPPPLSSANWTSTSRTWRSLRVKGSSTDRWLGRAGGGLTLTPVPPSGPWPNRLRAASLASAQLILSGALALPSASSSGDAPPRWLQPAGPNWVLRMPHGSSQLQSKMLVAVISLSPTVTLTMANPVPPRPAPHLRFRLSPQPTSLLSLHLSAALLVVTAR